MTYLAPTSAATASAEQAGIACSALRQLGAVRQIRDLAHVDAPSHSLPAAGAVAVIGVVPSENGPGGPCRVIAAW
jgi:hypothetical protein